MMRAKIRKYICTHLSPIVVFSFSESMSIWSVVNFIVYFFQNQRQFEALRVLPRHRQRGWRRVGLWMGKVHQKRGCIGKRHVTLRFDLLETAMVINQVKLIDMEVVTWIYVSICLEKGFSHQSLFVFLGIWRCAWQRGQVYAKQMVDLSYPE